jgi:hypothetical protein
MKTMTRLSTFLCGAALFALSGCASEPKAGTANPAAEEPAACCAEKTGCDADAAKDDCGDACVSESGGCCMDEKKQEP